MTYQVCNCRVVLCCLSKPVHSIIGCQATLNSHGVRLLFFVCVLDRTAPGAPQLTPLMKAIVSGDAASVSRVLEELTLNERRRELKVECARTCGRRGDGAGLPLSSPRTTDAVMLPIFHAASLGNVNVFMAVLGGLKGSLSDDEVSPQKCSCEIRCKRWFELVVAVVVLIFCRETLVFAIYRLFKTNLVC